MFIGQEKALNFFDNSATPEECKKEREEWEQRSRDFDAGKYNDWKPDFDFEDDETEN